LLIDSLYEGLYLPVSIGRLPEGVSFVTRPG
jgi:hypothetical protein